MRVQIGIGLLCIVGPLLGYETVMNVPASKELMLLRLTQEVQIANVSINPKIGGTGSYGDGIGIAEGYSANQITRSEPERLSGAKAATKRLDRDISRACWQLGRYQLLNTKFDQTQDCPSFITDRDQYPAKAWNGPGFNMVGHSLLARRTGVLHQFDSVDDKNWGVRRDSGSRVHQCSISSPTSSFVGPVEEPALAHRDKCQQGGENSENKRVEGDGIVPSSIPNYRQPLPEGFGWLVLIGMGIGAGIGAVYMLCLIWLANRPDKTTTNYKAHKCCE